MSEPELEAGERRAIISDSLGVGLATGAYALSFGAISVAAGLSVWQTCALSLLMFTGASQFAFIGVIAAGGAPLSAAFTAVLLGTRNGLYGLRLAPLLGWHGARRTAVAHLVLDESTAMSVMRPSRAAARLGFLATGLAVFSFWNLATLVGALAGSRLGDPSIYGLDAAVGAAFLALLWPRLSQSRSRLVGGVAAATALLFVPFTPAGVPVLVAGAIALLVGLLIPTPSPPDPEGIST
jgi:predicted branched-subunit amino acid permease